MFAEAKDGTMYTMNMDSNLKLTSSITTNSHTVNMFNASSTHPAALTVEEIKQVYFNDEVRDEYLNLFIYTLNDSRYNVSLKKENNIWYYKTTEYEEPTGK